MCRLEPIGRHRHRADTCVDSALNTHWRQIARPSNHAAAHAAPGNLGSDDILIFSQISLSPDQRHLADLQVIKLTHHIETRRSEQLAWTRRSGARATIFTAEVARERDFPDAIERMWRGAVVGCDVACVTRCGAQSSLRDVIAS